MKKSEHLKFMLERNRAATDRLLTDIDEEESLYCVDGYANHIRWEIGHMAWGLSLVLACLTGKTDFSEDWTKLFESGTVFSKDPSVYPSLHEIKIKSDHLYDKLFNALEQVSDDQLDEVAELLPGWNEMRMHGVAFLWMHGYYHCGQITVLRSALGKERQFD